ncbi:MAG TPA: ATP-dependent DNA helicase RuvA, partial [Urbifossiella sp.]|nr:ATP-dependent DNA helicase RuvA [Urbifossiella sp.]
IADAIARQDARWLSTLPGIGATTADQIVTTLKRKITPFVMAATPADAPPPDAVVEKASGRRKPAVSSTPTPTPVAFDGQAVDEAYQALMGLGLTPVEARTRLDQLMQSGQRFTTVQEALALIFANKG